MNKIINEVLDIFRPSSTPQGKKKPSGVNPNETKNVNQEDDTQLHLRNPKNVRKKYKPLSEKLINDHYRRHPYSFADQLSITEYLEESQTFMLEDCFSQAVVLSASPIATEGRSLDQIEELRDSLQQAFKQSFGISHGETDWVMQTYSWKDDDLYRYVDDVSDYIKPEIRESTFTQQFLGVMEDHFRGVNQPEGIFKDTGVTGKAWRGQMRKTYCVFYRRCSQAERQRPGFNPVREINDVAERFMHLLSSSGIKLQRLDGESVFRWLTDWFNPNPALTNGDREELYRNLSYPKRKEDKPFGFNLAESILFSEPISDPDNNCWWFDDVPHTYLRFRSLVSAPAMGQITGEVSRGAGKNKRSSCLMDSIPAGAILVQTIIFVSPTKIDSHLQSLSSADKGETQEAARARESLEEIERQRSQDQDIYYASQGVFVRGADLEDLRSRCNQVKNELLSNGVIILEPKKDALCVEAYPLHLPCCFEPAKDKQRQYMQLYYAQHLANMSPLFGREQGTGNPGMVAWNRGGEPLVFDMFGKDRVRAAHGVLLGPQGSGKSATLNYIAASVMAVHRPRLFILDKGGSFELLAEYFGRYDLTVNYMKINKSAKFSLCPFLDAGEVVKNINNPNKKTKIADDLIDDDDDVDRDPLSEMEQSLYIMVTGGSLEQFNQVTQQDKSYMRAAILGAGKKANQEGRKTLTRDVKAAMERLAEAPSIDEEQKRRLREMSAAIEMFCTGEMDAKIFDSEGEDWPDADVTVLDIGVYGDAAKYPAQLALAYIGYMQRVINKAEKTQYDSRDVVNIVDEAHLFTANPLLGYQIAFAIKVARKLGLWILLASQNVEDFSKGDDIKKILGLLEWWFLLNMEYKEVEDLCKYRNLTEEQKAMVLSCVKQKGAYTEAVIMGNPKTIGEMLVRQVPPSVFLALAMTDPPEKAERKRLMDTHNLPTHFDAAMLMAQELDHIRGIKVPPKSARSATYNRNVASVAL